MGEALCLLRVKTMKVTKRELGEDDSIIVRGPLRIKGITGRLRIANQPINSYLIKEGEVVAVEALDDCILSLYMKEGSSIIEKKRFLDVSFPQMWHKHARDILQISPATVMIVGGTDTGKTIFSSFLAKKGIEAGRTVALIDSDMGQSDIGPPTTLGMAFIDEARMRHMKPDALYFVGTTSVRNVEEVVVGVKKLCEAARDATLVIIDTCGFINEDIGRRLKNAKLELVNPDFVVGLQRKDELEYLLRSCPPSKVIRAPVGETVDKISREARRKIRETRFRKAFKNALERMYDLEELRVKNTYFHSGEKIEGKIFERLLGYHILHAEEIPEGYLVVRKRKEEEYQREETRMNSPTLKILEAGWDENLLCGLEKEGNCIGIGIIKRINYTNEMINIFSERMDFDTVKFGRIYVNESGEELGFCEWC